MIEGGRHPFDPAFVGYGASIPENILNGNLMKDQLDCEKFVKMKNLILKLLAPEPFKRFRNTEVLYKEIENCTGAYNEI
jgi:hypothetical protein